MFQRLVARSLKRVSARRGLAPITLRISRGQIHSIGLGFGLAAIGLVAVIGSSSTSLLHAEAPPPSDAVVGGMPYLELHMSSL